MPNGRQTGRPTRTAHLSGERHKPAHRRNQAIAVWTSAKHPQDRVSLGWRGKDEPARLEDHLQNGLVALGRRPFEDRRMGRRIGEGTEGRPDRRGLALVVGRNALLDGNHAVAPEPIGHETTSHEDGTRASNGGRDGSKQRGCVGFGELASRFCEYRDLADALRIDADDEVEIVGQQVGRAEQLRLGGGRRARRSR